MTDRRELPRWPLALVSGVTAVVLGWGAWMLPWHAWTTFAVTTAVVAAVHGTTAFLAVVGHPARGRAWRVQAVVALTWLGYLTWNLIASAFYVAELYGGLGRGVAVALGLVWSIVAALTIPMSAWGLAVTGGIRWPNRSARSGLAVLVALAAFGLWRMRDAAADTLLLPDATDTREAVEVAVPSPDELAHPAAGGRTDLMTDESFACAEPPSRDAATVLVAFLTPGVVDRPEPAVRCVQGQTLAEAAEAVHALLLAEAVQGPVKIDVITAARAIEAVAPVVDGLSLRPGLDGVCDGPRCYAPWQMLAHDLFTSVRPIPVVPELRFGFDPVQLRRVLAASDRRGPVATGAEGLTRIETASFVTDAQGALQRLRRLRTAGPELDSATLDRGLAGVETFVTSAVGSDGRFAYIRDPFTGQVHFGGFSLARQAGAVLVVCELARDRERARKAATAALEMLASVQRVHGDIAALAYPPERDVEEIGLGDSALSAISFLSCRDLVGDQFDQVIDRLTRFLLAMQRPDGSFYPRIAIADGRPIHGPDPLYAVGQAVFALTLLEQLTADPEVQGFADHERVRAAVQAAMDYITTDYWHPFVSDFFWMEENWHCLAARASLGHHRHDAYEKFCLDYVTYKSRLILAESDRVDRDLVGGYGFGNVLLPHNTGASGFGEAAAAAIAVAKARGDDYSNLEAAERRVLRFLLHHQWRPPSCFACREPELVYGGFSEHMGSPHMRIDYGQHAMSAMGHGGHQLGLIDGPGW